jgi:hypothetical protein
MVWRHVKRIVRTLLIVPDIMRATEIEIAFKKASPKFEAFKKAYIGLEQRGVNRYSSLIIAMQVKIRAPWTYDKPAIGTMNNLPSICVSPIIYL